MATTYKSQAIAHELADRLKKRLAFLTSTITLKEGVDSSGNPTISIDDGTAATTEKNVFIRVQPIDWALATDILGLSANEYAPHVCQVATEAVTTNGTYLSPDDLMQLLLTCASMGTKMEWWQETNGTVPTVTTFSTASKRKSECWPDLYGTMRAAQ
jgi:hypothetical protein